MNPALTALLAQHSLQGWAPVLLAAGFTDLSDPRITAQQLTALGLPADVSARLLAASRQYSPVAPTRPPHESERWWFVGEVAAGETRLATCPPGTFYVRNSSAGPGFFSCTHVTPRKTVEKFLIVSDARGYYTQDNPGAPAPSLAALVTQLTQTTTLKAGLLVSDVQFPWNGVDTVVPYLLAQDYGMAGYEDPDEVIVEETFASPSPNAAPAQRHPASLPAHTPSVRFLGPIDTSQSAHSQPSQPAQPNQPAQPATHLQPQQHQSTHGPVADQHPTQPAHAQPIQQPHSNPPSQAAPQPTQPHLQPTPEDSLPSAEPAHPNQPQPQPTQPTPAQPQPAQPSPEPAPEEHTQASAHAQHPPPAHPQPAQHAQPGPAQPSPAAGPPSPAKKKVYKMPPSKKAPAPPLPELNLAARPAPPDPTDLKLSMAVYTMPDELVFVEEPSPVPAGPTPASPKASPQPTSPTSPTSPTTSPAPERSAKLPPKGPHQPKAVPGKGKGGKAPPKTKSPRPKTPDQDPQLDSSSSHEPSPSPAPGNAGAAPAASPSPATATNPSEPERGGTPTPDDDEALLDLIATQFESAFPQLAARAKAPPRKSNPPASNPSPSPNPTASSPSATPVKRPSDPKPAKDSPPSAPKRSSDAGAPGAPGQPKKLLPKIIKIVQPKTYKAAPKAQPHPPQPQTQQPHQDEQSTLQPHPQPQAQPQPQPHAQSQPQPQPGAGSLVLPPLDLANAAAAPAEEEGELRDSWAVELDPQPASRANLWDAAEEVVASKQSRGSGGIRVSQLLQHPAAQAPEPAPASLTQGPCSACASLLEFGTSGGYVRCYRCPAITYFAPPGADSAEAVVAEAPLQLVSSKPARAGVIKPPKLCDYACELRADGTLSWYEAGRKGKRLGWCSVLGECGTLWLLDHEREMVPWAFGVKHERLRVAYQTKKARSVQIGDTSASLLATFEGHGATNATIPVLEGRPADYGLVGFQTSAQLESAFEEFYNSAPGICAIEKKLFVFAAPSSEALAGWRQAITSVGGQWSERPPAPLPRAQWRSLATAVWGPGNLDPLNVPF